MDDRRFIVEKSGRNFFLRRLEDGEETDWTPMTYEVAQEVARRDVAVWNRYTPVNVKRYRWWDTTVPNWRDNFNEGAQDDE